MNQVEDEVSEKRQGLKILFLSSDTGGGHRASAESLAKQFEILFPGSTYDLLDVIAKDGIPPYNSLTSYYKHLSAHPSQWKIVYSVSNSRAFEMIFDAQMKLLCERAIRKRIQGYNPDVVVSVHPMMTNVPVVSCAKISNETGKHLPMFTVVTDLGSAHSLWFANGVEKLFVGSETLKELAMERGKVPEEKIVLAGLPIRHDFAIQAENLGNRYSEEGILYQRKIREQLELPHVDRRTILIMGGGEGVGSLSNIVNALYVELTSQGINAVILVVCGRNEKLKDSINERNWAELFESYKAAKARGLTGSSLLTFSDACGGYDTFSNQGCVETQNTVTGSIRRILSTGSIGRTMSRMSKRNAVSQPSPGETFEEKKVENVPPVESETKEAEEHEIDAKEPGQVSVRGLGFVTNMAEYMVAADVLVSKAGPGTISEAAALSLPVMLTSFLPGQEEGNVDFVINGGFGAFVADSDPDGIAEEVCMWLTDEKRLQDLSIAAKSHGAPHAARDIAEMIGNSTMKWKELNEDHQ